MDTVKNVGSHPEVLADGRPIGPGETAVNVDLGDPHNKDLLDQGHVAVLNTEPAEPSKRRTAEPKPDPNAGGDR